MSDKTIQAIKAGGKYRDAIGPFRVLAIVEGYAMVRRPREEPFVIAVNVLARRLQSWTAHKALTHEGGE